MSQSIAAGQHAIAIEESSQIGSARRAAARMAAEAGADEKQGGRLALIVTELATNIVRHSRGGEILLQVVHLPDGSMMETMAIDRGPGIRELDRCLADGYSTGGTAGNGLGAISRLSDEFDIFSTPEKGTVVMARVAAGERPSAPISRLRFGVLSKPYPGELVCGDAWGFFAGESSCSLFIVDGLGHGERAAEAARRATDGYAEDPLRNPSDLVRKASERMSGTRGAALAAGLLEYDRGMLRYCGVGNISGRLITGDYTRGLLSHNGTAGLPGQKIQELEYPWNESMWVMHSDGLQTRWNMEAYPGLMRRHPAIVAGVLARDFTRGRDDVTVAVVAP
jgi:anti-sigma regulatory factor (Ser/Thr protein kinase)